MSRPQPVHSAPDTDTRSLADVDRRLAFAFGGLILALLVVVLLASGLYLRGVMEREENRLSTLLTEVLSNAVSRVSFSGKYHARLLLEEIKAAQPGIRYLRLVDPNGNVLAHSDAAHNDRPLDADSLDVCVVSSSPASRSGKSACPIAAVTTTPCKA